MKKINITDYVIFDNEDYLAINKPPFLSTLEDRNDSQNALELVRSEWPGAKVCHRIDKETSGVLLFAKSDASYRHTSIQFEKRKVKKEYHAVVHGRVDIKDVAVEEPIRLLGNGKVCIDKHVGKKASTTFDTIEIFKFHSLIKCLPLTGRMHQIRIHVASKGTPIVGDELYGGEPFYLSSIKSKFSLKKKTEEQPLIKRFALHAFRLEFSDQNAKKISIDAPYPKDFGVLLKQLRINA